MSNRFETDCRLFYTQFPTRNVREGIRLAESGVITWENLYRVLYNSLRTAINEVN